MLRNFIGAQEEKEKMKKRIKRNCIIFNC